MSHLGIASNQVCSAATTLRKSGRRVFRSQLTPAGKLSPKAINLIATSLCSSVTHTIKALGSLTILRLHFHSMRSPLKKSKRQVTHLHRWVVSKSITRAKWSTWRGQKKKSSPKWVQEWRRVKRKFRVKAREKKKTLCVRCSSRSAMRNYSRRDATKSKFREKRDIGMIKSRSELPLSRNQIGIRDITISSLHWWIAQEKISTKAKRR